MSYQKINLSADLNLVWPELFTPGTAICSVNNVVPSGNGFSIFLPSAISMALDGTCFKFNNLSTYSFKLIAYGQSVPLYTIGAGNVVEIYLSSNSSNSNAWSVVPPGTGPISITNLTLASSDSSIAIAGGSVSAPGGSVDFKLPTSISNILGQISSTGFPVVSGLSPLAWKSVHLVAGDNISINNPDGVASDPVISLSPVVSAINSISVGGLTISGEIIDANDLNGNVSISSNGTGKVYVNGMSVDASANVSGINNLSITGKFTSPLTPTLFVRFTDTLVSGGNTVSVVGGYGYSSVTGFDGTYKIHSLGNLPNLNYAVFINTFSTDSSMPLVTSAYPILTELDGVTIAVVDAGGEKVSSVPNGISVMIMSSS